MVIAKEGWVLDQISDKHGVNIKLDKAFHGSALLKQRICYTESWKRLGQFTKVHNIKNFSS